MRNSPGIMKRAIMATGLASAVLLGGCAGSDVEISGPGFQIGGNKSKKEARVPDRAPLLVPPDRARLPEPVPEQPQAVAAQPNWPNDPDLVRKSEEEEKLAKKSEYEDKGDWSGKGGAREFDKLGDSMERKETGILQGVIDKMQ
mgnify:FL=1